MRILACHRGNGKEWEGGGTCIQATELSTVQPLDLESARNLIFV